MYVTKSMPHRRLLITILTVICAVSYTLVRGSWPEIMTFAAEAHLSLAERLLSSPVHLADDVMIQLRSGILLVETGSPAYNRTDIAQGSTSLLAPYLFALFYLIMPTNLAVGIYALTGALAVALTWALIVYKSKAAVNGVLLVGGLSLTTTNLSFTLNGWDHLIQGLFVAIAVALALSQHQSSRTLVTASLFSGAAVLARPDGALIGAATVFTLLLTSNRRLRATWVSILAPFGLTVGIGLLVNISQFGTLTPTTTRLKSGGAPNLGYAWDYIWTNGVTSFSAITFFLILLTVSWVFWSNLDWKRILPIYVAAVATAVVAVVNSDIFPDGRMFWVPTIALTVILSMNLPAIVTPGPLFRGVKGVQTNSTVRVGLLGVAVSIMLVITASVGLRNSVVSESRIAESRTAQQFVATQWVKRELDPGQGAVGFFFAGEAFHLPAFESADFLGKTDESVAKLERNWGPPGHNKWDIGLTLRKWNPQIILPAVDLDPRSTSDRFTAQEWLDNEWDHGYAAALILDPMIQDKYTYCRVPYPNREIDVTVDVLLRNDLVQKSTLDGECT